MKIFCGTVIICVLVLAFVSAQTSNRSGPSNVNPTAPGTNSGQTIITPGAQQPLPSATAFPSTPIINSTPGGSVAPFATPPPFQPAGGSITPLPSATPTPTVTPTPA